MGGERSVNQVFQRRAEEVQQQGFGLSVDVYSPNLFELMSRFERAPTRPAYLEIFRAAAAALETVTRRMTGVSFAYHGEGLWITQPDFARAPHMRDELDDVISQLHILASPWLNHECATKQMAGYSFGTYLPPLYTAESAKVVADNIEIVQAKWMNGGRQARTSDPCSCWRCRHSPTLWPGLWRFQPTSGSSLI
jgi:hypothetical protein